AFTFHMLAQDRDGLSDRREPRVLWPPTNGASGLPFQLTTTDAPSTRVSFDTPRAPGSNRRAPAIHNGKNPPFDLLSGFRPCRSHFACPQGRKLPHTHTHPGSNHPDRPHRP